MKGTVIISLYLGLGVSLLAEEPKAQYTLCECRVFICGLMPYAKLLYLFISNKRSRHDY